MVAEVPWWRAKSDAQQAAEASLADALADARLDDYAPPQGLVPPSDMRAAEEFARRKIGQLLPAAADPSGRIVAKEMGLLDDADIRLSGDALKMRLWRKFYFRELGSAIARAGHILEAHKCWCACARSCDTYRDLFVFWASRLLDDKRRAMADAVARLGERRGAFEYANQRPVSGFIRGLRVNGNPGPWYEPETIAVARALLKWFPQIQAEYRALYSASGPTVLSGDADGEAFERYPSPAIAQGEWSDFMLIHAGRRHAPHCARCPTLSRLLFDAGSPLRVDAASMVVGSCFFSRMKPGTHLRAHCGPSNLRLRVHLGVDVPSAGGWNIRVGDEVRQWREGECLVFDDSWEHEVWHEATPGDAQRMGGPAGPGAGCGADSRARVVLIVDIWHPAIPCPERRGHLPSEQGDKYEAIVRGSGPLEAMTERELSDGSIRRVRGD
jgi:hypothetical protein